MNDDLTHKTRPTTEADNDAGTGPGPIAQAGPLGPTEPAVPTTGEQDQPARDSLLRQAGRAAVLSLAGTPALLVAAVVERWLSTR
ncbi:hypothetical protein [Kitasatospora sp. NPDC057223]|uniref:hypothetical protein n=1 Tax=Kitasatospora sp. NPDC057223 TaxID=3346055 RepID=UPI00363EC035